MAPELIFLTPFPCNNITQEVGKKPIAHPRIANWRWLWRIKRIFPIKIERARLASLARSSALTHGSSMRLSGGEHVNRACARWLRLLMMREIEVARCLDNAPNNYALSVCLLLYHSAVKVNRLAAE